MAKQQVAWFVFGLPGSGKSTLCSQLARRYQVQWINVGLLLKKLIRDNRDDLETNAAREAVASGSTAPNWLVQKLIAQELRERRKNHTIFDGYPRDHIQLGSLPSFLENHHFSAKGVLGILLDIPVEVVFTRIAKRRMCKNCGTPEIEPIAECPNCSGAMERRADDLLHVTMGARIDWFYKHELPIAEYFKANYALLWLSAELTQQEVLSRLLKFVG